MDTEKYLDISFNESILGYPLPDSHFEIAVILLVSNLGFFLIPEVFHEIPKSAPPIPILFFLYYQHNCRFINQNQSGT